MLAGILVDIDLDCRVLLSDLLEGLDELWQVVHVLGLDGLGDDRLRDMLDRLEGSHLDRGDCRPSNRAVKTGYSGNIAGRNLVDLLALATHENTDVLEPVFADRSRDVQLLALLE